MNLSLSKICSSVCLGLSRFSFGFFLSLWLCLGVFFPASINAASVEVTQVQYLSGTDKDNTVAWDFFCTAGRKSGAWTTIQVPSCWEQQGFGTYNYGRDYRTYGKEHSLADEQGMYKHLFNVPVAWKGREVFIVFEGSMTDTEVKINGVSAGPVHQGAFYRFKYNISDKLKFGAANLLEVTVHKMSADQSVNSAERLADYWVFGGIFRPVYLESLPKQHIERFSIDAKADGSFRAEVYSSGLTGVATVKAEILDGSGKVVGTVAGTAPVGGAPGTAAVSASGSAEVVGLSGAIPGSQPLILSTQVTDPDTWTSETPSLYRVRISLLNGSKVLHQVTDVFGFRTMEIRQGDGIYINGVKVKMKGLNRHVFWPETGRTVSRAVDLLDVQLMKEMNLNAVRCSHYPPDKSFLYLCDSLGLYVLDELTGWQNAYNTTVGEKLVPEMVLRDVNHPSVIFWTNGNEGGTNKALDDDFLIWDFSKRPVIHPHHQPGNAFGGIDCNHYEGYESTLQLLQGPNIYMPTEFLHAQDDGGGGAALFDYWEAMWKAPLSGGGFLWAYVDEGLVRTDLGGMIDANRINAPDGVVGPHREKEGSFFALREIFSPVQIQIKELPASFNGVLPVENRYHFTNLNKCTFQWKLVQFRAPSDVVAAQKEVASGKVQGPSVAPLAKGSVNLSLPASWKTADALVLSVFDSNGTLIQYLSWKIQKNAVISGRVVKMAGQGEVGVTENDQTVTLKASGISVSLSKENGNLSQLRYDAGLPLPFRNGPVLVGGTSVFAGLKHFRESDGYVVEVTYTGDMKSARWKMYPSGWISLEYEYSLVKGEHKFAGITFDFPEVDMMSVKYVGVGPYRVWKNRLQGGTFEAWEKGYNNTRTGLAPWEYPEFKGYYADVAWMEFNTVDGKFLMATPDENIFVRLFDFYSVYGPAPSHPELPAGDISFMDAIPPTGSKPNGSGSDNASNLGPLSRFTSFDGPKKHTLWFYFGLPK